MKILINILLVLGVINQLSAQSGQFTEPLRQLHIKAQRLFNRMQTDFNNLRSDTTQIITTINEYALNEKLTLISTINMGEEDMNNMFLNSPNEECISELRIQFMNLFARSGNSIAEIASYTELQIHAYVYNIFENLDKAQQSANELSTLVLGHFSEWNPMANTLQEFLNIVDSAINRREIFYNESIRLNNELALGNFKEAEQIIIGSITDNIQSIKNYFTEEFDNLVDIFEHQCVDVKINSI